GLHREEDVSGIFYCCCHKPVRASGAVQQAMRAVLSAPARAWQRHAWQIRIKKSGAPMRHAGLVRPAGKPELVARARGEVPGREVGVVRNRLPQGKRNADDKSRTNHSAGTVSPT